MYNKTITLDPDRPDRPLDPLRAMRHSAGRLLFADLPADLTAAAFVVSRTGETPVVLAIDTESAELLIENGVNAVAGAGEYYVYGFENLRIFGLGYGTYTVVEAPTLAAAAGVTPVGNSVPILNPDTGLYHTLTATANELGQIVIDIAQEGTAA